LIDGMLTLERLGALRQEKRVVLAPSDQKRRLVRAKIGLECGIQRDVALVDAGEFFASAIASVMLESPYD
jgi:hypothetical protein